MMTLVRIVPLVAVVEAGMVLLEASRSSVTRTLVMRVGRSCVGENVVIRMLVEGVRMRMAEVGVEWGRLVMHHTDQQRSGLMDYLTDIAGQCHGSWETLMVVQASRMADS